MRLEKEGKEDKYRTKGGGKVRVETCNQSQGGEAHRKQIADGRKKKKIVRLAEKRRGKGVRRGRHKALLILCLALERRKGEGDVFATMGRDEKGARCAGGKAKAKTMSTKPHARARHSDHEEKRNDIHQKKKKMPGGEKRGIRFEAAYLRVD